MKCFPKSICSAVTSKEPSKQSEADKSQPSKAESDPLLPAYQEPGQMVLAPMAAMPNHMPNHVPFAFMLNPYLQPSQA